MPEEALESTASSTAPGAAPEPQAGATESPGTGPENAPGKTIEVGSDWVEPPKTPKGAATEAGAEPSVELDTDLLRGMVHSAFNIPSAFWGPHLVRTEAQIEPVVAPLQAVIKKYNIDLMNYLPEALLALALIGTGSGMYADHQKYLATREDQPDQPGDEEPGQPPGPQEQTGQAATGYFDRTPQGVNT